MDGFIENSKRYEQPVSNEVFSYFLESIDEFDEDFVDSVKKDDHELSKSLLYVYLSELSEKAKEGKSYEEAKEILASEEKFNQILTGLEGILGNNKKEVDDRLKEIFNSYKKNSGSDDIIVA